MYEKDGVFGRTRLGYIPDIREYGECLDRVTYSGWHSCNELYMIMRRPTETDETLIELTTDGVGELIICGKRYVMRRNSMAIIPFTLGHTYYTQPGADNSWTFSWIQVSGVNCTRIIDAINRRFGFTFRVDGAEQINQYMLNIIDSKMRGVEYEIETSRLISDILLSVLLEKSVEKENGSKRQSCTEKVIDYIEQHIDEDLRVETIARSLFLSPEHIIRTFRKEKGQTPYQYIKARKMLRAKKLLQTTNIPLKEVAEMVGYSSLNAFSTQFKNTMGISPREFRMRYR
jgi:AraC-like DNA-binding protein